MIYPLDHEKTYLCASFERRRAPNPGGGAALVRCFRPPSLSNPVGQLQGRECLPDRQESWLQPSETVRNAIHAFNERGLPEALQRGSKRPHTIRRAFQGPEHTVRLRSEEHTSELQSRQYLVCRLLLEKKKTSHRKPIILRRVTSLFI